MSRTSLWQFVERASTVAVLIAAIVVVSTRLVGNKPPSKGLSVPKQPISIDGAPLLGNPQASTALIVYTDFQCPFCARFEQEVWPQIRSTYVDTGHVLVAFRHLPLPIHQHAEKAAEAAECAGRSGKFWEMHDRLFVDQTRLDDASLLKDARDLGLSSGAWEACYRAGAAEARVRADISQAKELGISGTPAFFVGRRQADGSVQAVASLVGFRPIDSFKTAFDAAAR